jgi:hypothetical protein
MRSDHPSSRPIRRPTTPRRISRTARRLRFAIPLVFMLWSLGFWTALAQTPGEGAQPLPWPPAGPASPGIANSPSAEPVQQEFTPPPVATLPEPGVAEVALGRAAARAGESVFSVAAADNGPDSAPIQVETLSQDAVKRINGQVLAFAVRAPQAAAARDVAVTIDYSGFEFAYGGDWIGRVRVYRLPECALTTPEQEECQERELVPSTLDETQRTISLKLTTSPGRSGDAPGRRDQAGFGGNIYTLTAGTSSASGDYAASPLASNGSWAVNLQSGDYNYSYGINLPPAAYGATPELGLHYASGAVDGMTSATNNQSSVVGIGWNLTTNAAITRSYVTCADDGYGTYQDLCWAGDNLSITLNGVTSRLVLVTGHDSWDLFRLENDPSWRLERYRDGSSGNNNGDNNGEFWLVKTPDGNIYRFGAGPQSAQVVPVFGNQLGEPCYNTAASTPGRCDQAWRWLLEYANVPNSTWVSYAWTEERNRYAVRGYGTGEPTGAVTDPLNPIGYYDRAASLTSITYPGGSIVLNYSWRCTVTPCTGSYPDTPMDLDCNGVGYVCPSTKPSFWTQNKLSYVDVMSNSPSSNNSGSVSKRYLLTYTWIAAGPNGASVLWLQNIQERATINQTGALVYAPDMRFDPVSLANRWSSSGSSLFFPRLGRVRDEIGSETSVTYGQPLPCSAAVIPPTVQWYNNQSNCYPEYYAGSFATVQ